MVIKIPKTFFDAFDYAARGSLAIEHKVQLCDNFSSELFIFLTPFSQG